MFAYVSGAVLSIGDIGEHAIFCSLFHRIHSLVGKVVDWMIAKINSLFTTKASPKKSIKH